MLLHTTTKSWPCHTHVYCASSNLSSWSEVFMLVKCILASPAASHRLCWQEILNLVKFPIQKWQGGDMVSLWTKAVSGGKSLSKHRPPSSSSSQQSCNLRRARLAIQDGQYSKAINSLTSNGLATPSDEVLQEMLAKHPQTAPPNSASWACPPPASVTKAVVCKCIQSFPNGSAPGPSGLHPSHLQEAVGCPSPDWACLVLSSLTRFINLIVAGKTPPIVIPHLCGATLLANKKKSGEHCPIAVREVLHCLASKCLANLVRLLALSLLSPLQLGVCVRGECEAVIHSTHHLISSLPDERRWALLLDFTNAFNNIRCEAMFLEFHRHLLELSAWMESCYSGQPFLHLGKDTILSCCGVQQGDPLGPLGFALALHPVLKPIKAEVPTLALNAWYLDDGTLVGPPEEPSVALRIVEQDGPSVGLHLNRGNSLLFVPKDCVALQFPLPPEISTTHAGFCLLGSSIGSPTFSEEVLWVKVAEIRESESTT